MVSLAHNDMQMCLPILLRIADALLEDLFCLFDELAVEIDGVVCDAAGGVVFSEDVVGGLLVIGVHLRGVFLAFFAQLVRGGAVAAFVCCVRLVEAA